MGPPSGGKWGKGGNQLAAKGKQDGFAKGSAKDSIGHSKYDSRGPGSNAKGKSKGSARGGQYINASSEDAVGCDLWTDAADPYCVNLNSNFREPIGMSPFQGNSVKGKGHPEIHGGKGSKSGIDAPWEANMWSSSAGPHVGGPMTANHGHTAGDGSWSGGAAKGKATAAKGKGPIVVPPPSKPMPVHDDVKFFNPGPERLGPNMGFAAGKGNGYVDGPGKGHFQNRGNCMVDEYGKGRFDNHSKAGVKGGSYAVPPPAHAPSMPPPPLPPSQHAPTFFPPPGSGGGPPSMPPALQAPTFFGNERAPQGAMREPVFHRDDRPPAPFERAVFSHDRCAPPREPAFPSPMHPPVSESNLGGYDRPPAMQQPQLPPREPPLVSSSPPQSSLPSHSSQFRGPQSPIPPAPPDCPAFPPTSPPRTSAAEAFSRSLQGDAAPAKALSPLDALWTNGSLSPPPSSPPVRPVTEAPCRTSQSPSSPPEGVSTSSPQPTSVADDAKSESSPQKRVKEDAAGDDAKSESSPQKRVKEDVLEELEAMLRGPSMLQRSDFDGRARQTLHAIHAQGGRHKVKEALESISLSTKSKTRQSVRNWQAYVATLLRKFLEELGSEDREARARNRVRAARSLTAPAPSDDNSNFELQY